jgi:hypothetical protein
MLYKGKIRKMKDSSKIQSTHSLCTMRIHLASISIKEVLCSCGTKEKASLDMKEKTTVHGLAPTSSRRSQTKKATI